MPQDVFDEIEAPASSDVFDEIAPEKKDVFDEIEGGKPVIREVQPGSIPPTDLFPAIRKIGGEIVPGQIGDTHPDIIRREGIPATDIDQRGFTTPWGDFLDREAAAQGTQLPTAFEPGRLHSTDLIKFQEGLEKPLEEAAASEAPQPFVKLPEPSARPSPIAYAPVKAVFGQKGVDITKSVFDTVYNTAKSVPEFLQTEEGMLAMLASATPLGRAGVEAYFTGDMIKSLWDQAKSGVKDWDSLSAAQKASRITQAIATLGFTGFLAKAGIGTIKQAIKKPASLLAPTVPQAPAKPEEVTPAAVQAPPDIAKELGVESVGTSMGRDHYQFPTGKTEAGMEMDRVQVPAGSSIDVVRDAIEKRKAQVAKEFAKEEPPKPSDAQAAADEIGFTLSPEKQIGSMKLTGLTKSEISKLRDSGQVPEYEFTDRRPGSPTEGVTFYVPEGATKEQILATYKNKVADFEKGTPPVAPTPVDPAPAPIAQEPALVGLGAAEKGEAAPGTQIEQLTQALKGVQEKRAPLVEQVKDAFSVGDRLSAAQDTVGKALSGMKAAGDMIISKWKGIPKIDDLLRAKKTLSRAIESRGWRLLKWEQQAKKSVPNPRDQAAIAKWIDAGGDRATLEKGLAEAPDKFKRAYQDALNLSGDKLTTAQNVQNYFESRLQEAIDAGVLDHGIDNYIHRMYESKPDILKRAIAYTQTGLLKTNPALAKKRFFQFDWEAEKAGYVPVQSFIKRITAYEASLSKAIAAREFIKSASEMKASDGRPVIDIKGVGIPIEDPAGVYREATLIKPKFNPARNNEPTLPNGNPNPNYRGDYVNRDYRALSRWKWVGSDAGGKPIYVQGDVAIHPEYANRVDALLKPSQVRYGKYGSILRPALGVSSTIKQTMLDLSGFHPVQIAVHGMEHRVMPWSVIKDIDLSHPDVEGLLQGGVTLGGDYTGLHSEGLIGSSLTRRIPGLGPVMESYHQWLFQSFIPRIKMTMALHALERNRVRYAGRLTEEQIFHKTASEANAAFGELNYTVLERSKTAQDMARLILLAPDFLEARGRFAGQAFQRGGKAFGHEQRTALLLGALTMWVTARIANKMIDGQYHNEPENLFNIVKDGHAYGMRTVQGDLLHLLTKPMQFAMSRLNPVYARTLLEALTGRDYFGRKRTPAEQVWDAASTTIPISLRSNRERKLWESMLNGIGVTARRYSDVDDAFKLAQKWKDKNAVPERGEFIYDPNKDILRPLKLALNHGDEVTASKEIKALIDSKVYNLKKLDEYFKRFASMPFTGSKANDSKFIKSLTEDQRKTVEAARQHKNEIRKLYMKSRGQYLAPPSQL